MICQSQGPTQQATHWSQSEVTRHQQSRVQRVQMLEGLSAHLLCGLRALLLLVQELGQPQALLVIEQGCRDLGCKQEAQGAEDSSPHHEASQKATSIVPLCPAYIQSASQVTQNQVSHIHHHA